MPIDIIQSSRALATTSRAVIESARALRVECLRAELKVAHSMLDASCTTYDEVTRERRRLRAEQACSEVLRALAEGLPMVYLTDAERQELTAGLARMYERLAAPC